MERLLNQISSDEWRPSIWVHLWPCVEISSSEQENEKHRQKTNQKRADISCTKTTQFYENNIKNYECVPTDM